MITKNTVLVLGAGVSYPYDYPVGIDLYHAVCENIRKGRLDFLISKGIEKKHMEKFVSNLEKSQLKSIDLFLLNRPEFVDIGKISIAYELLRLENSKRLNMEFKKTDSNYNRWKEGIYSYLFQNMVDNGWKKFALNKIAFITFNYDRSLEQFLFTALKSSSGLEDQIVSGMMQKIKIHHVYGSLGPLSWQESDGRAYKCLDLKPPNTNTSYDDIMRAAQNLTIIYEENNIAFLFPEINSAYRIYFLGFGYHEINLERLKILNSDFIKSVDFPKTHKSRGSLSRMCGNAYSIGDSIIRKLEKQWGIHIPQKGKTDLYFLQNIADLD